MCEGGSNPMGEGNNQLGSRVGLIKRGKRGSCRRTDEKREPNFIMEWKSYIRCRAAHTVAGFRVKIITNGAVCAIVFATLH